MWVKICGITRLEDAAVAACFGADAVGFVFADSPRRISPERARDIADSMPPGPVKVGVFQNHPTEEVIETAGLCNLDYVQLHGDEDEEYCLSLGIPVIKALRVRETNDILRAQGYPCQALLLDGYYGRNHSGSSGEVDWRMARMLTNDKRLIVAGGLNPENVEEVISSLKPFGVDVSSGVETAPGVKDPLLIYRFIERSRKTAYEVSCN